MFDAIPAYAWPFILAVIAVVVGFVMNGRAHGEADHLASRILYMVALGCVIIGFATIWLSHRY
jgi:hypothetical protein